MRSQFDEQPLKRFYRPVRAALVATALACPPLVWAGDQDVAEGSVAAAIREAGYPCAHVVDMERSREGAAEGLTVWNVRCNSGQFKVTFKGDAGSEVVRLD